jgi:hypothetical protein
MRIIGFALNAKIIAVNVLLQLVLFAKGIRSFINKKVNVYLFVILGFILKVVMNAKNVIVSVFNAMGFLIALSASLGILNIMESVSVHVQKGIL